MTSRRSFPPGTLRRHAATAAVVLAAALATGCASVSPTVTLAEAQRLSADPGLTLRTDRATREAARQQADAALAQPLDADAAVRLALLASPALQALLAEAWAADQSAQLGARPASLHLAWERMTADGGVELTRMLGLNLSDWLLWPLRQPAADQASRAARLQLAAQVLALRQSVRQQWVRAVAARELDRYQQQVRDAADASTELARRMQAVGNFSRLQRLRQQAFQAEAVGRQTVAAQARVAEQEALVRLLGLDSEQAQRLQLPDRLPALPARPLDALEVASAAAKAGGGLQMQASQASAEAQRALPGAMALVPGLELNLSRIREGDERRRAVELGFDIPLADLRSPRLARLLAAEHRAAQATIDAASQLRERYAGYRLAHQLAQHQRQVLVPLRQSIQDETVLAYNGMLTGVFELLAEARAQVGAVIAAVESQRDFWLADAGLQAAIDGAPLAASALSSSSAGESRGGSGGH